MRAISLWQPWASAVALGLKKIETRHWATDYRGPLAIHAAKRWQADQQEFAAIERGLGRLPSRLPFGAIVAVVDLVDVRATDELVLTIHPIEKMYGNYSPGRFGWILHDVRALPEPIPCKGHQSFFSVPDDGLPLTAQQQRDNRERHGHFGSGLFGDGL